MNLNHLRHFYVVADKESFSEAAACLHVSQPAVSKSVSELEMQLGLALIERASKGRKLRLTESGSVLFDYARSIFALEKAATNAISARQKVDQGYLTLGLSPTIANYWSIALLKQFINQFPGISVNVVVDSTRRICSELIDCNIDIALVEGEAIDDSLFDIQCWKKEPMVLVGKPQKGSGPSFDNEQWLLRETGSMTRTLMDNYLDELKINPKKIMEVGSNEAIARMVNAGMGFSILPEIVATQTINSETVYWHQSRQFLYRELSLISCHNRPLSPAASAFRDIALQFQALRH